MDLERWAVNDAASKKGGTKLMKYNNNMKHLFRMFGIGVLSVAIAGCGSTGGKTKTTNTAAVQNAQLADIEKTSLKKYGADEKTSDGMRVKNSDGTYTYGVANVDTTKLRKDKGISVGYDDNSKIYDYASTLNGDRYNSILFSKTENNELVGIDMNIKIDDNTLAEYKKAGVLPANATKKTAKKMVEKEIAYIKNTLKRDVDKDSVDMSDRLTVLDYEYMKSGYYMDLSDKEKNNDGGKPKYTVYISDAVETYMIDLGNDNFSAGVIFNIGSGNWNAGNKAIQIIGQRYGFDSLCKDDKYSTDIDKIGGIIDAFRKINNYSSKQWNEENDVQFHNEKNADASYEMDDEFYKLSIS